MSVVEHLEDLRRALIVSLIGWTVTTIIAFVFWQRILELLVERAGLQKTGLIFLAPTGGFMLGLKIALQCKDPFGKRLAAGLTALVCGQAAINLAAVMGLAPLTGIPLPFVSYGGSSLIVGLAAVGILLNIAGSHGAAARAVVPDRSRGNGRTRAAGARSRRSAAGTQRAGDVRRVARSRRSPARS